jgi:DUF971 family protein
MQPEKIKILDNKYLWMKWNDDTESKINLQKMREMCPCATCLAERNHQSKNYIPLLFNNQITISGIETVGSYAIQINWQDGHNTGIYEYPFLKNLAADSNQA